MLWFVKFRHSQLFSSSKLNYKSKSKFKSSCNETYENGDLKKRSMSILSVSIASRWNGKRKEVSVYQQNSQRRNNGLHKTFNGLCPDFMTVVLQIMAPGLGRLFRRNLCKAL